jgi:hypothetical protein
MAEDKEDRESPKEDVLLVAHVRAWFLNGDFIDLLPFKHEQDVRAEVNRFVEDWVKSGFLLKENCLYPWHQVKNLQVASVKALSHAEAAPYLEVWRLDTEAQKDFWKTRKTQGSKADDKGDKG